MRIEAAISLALRCHTGQMDEDGSYTYRAPHILHCMEVMLAVKHACEYKCHTPFVSLSARAAQKIYTDEELIIAAILHDTVEDSPENPTALERVDLAKIELLFGPKIKTLVDGVTRRKGGKEKEPYRDFIYRTRTDPGVRLIKIADVLHNLSRTHKIKKASRRNKLEYKYAIAMRVLNSDNSWEQESREQKRGKFYISDPNGKRIEITEAEFIALAKL